MDEENEHLVFLAYEALLRRTAELRVPAMLKGSFVSRQYMPDPQLRRTADLDWVYMGFFDEVKSIRKHLDNWMIQATELQMDDGVQFTSFRANQFWRMIDYAMADDFPTVNTDLRCTLNGEDVDLCMDVSFNLPIEPGPIPLSYRTYQGEIIDVPYTCPISLQVAWKLHQTIVQPRYKDIFDLIILLQHPDFDEEARRNCLQSLVNECHADKVDPRRLIDYISDKEARLLESGKARQRTPGRLPTHLSDYDLSLFLTDTTRITLPPSALLHQFSSCLNQAGLTEGTMETLPLPTRRSRSPQ